jgi:hypothetical protein
LETAPPGRFLPGRENVKSENPREKDWVRLSLVTRRRGRKRKTHDREEGIEGLAKLPEPPPSSGLSG